jgi:hypothetical protein
MDELTIDELTLFRDFRSESGGPSAAETTAARARLLDAIADEGSATPRRMWWRQRMAWLGPFGRTRFWAPAAAAAAVIAVTVTMSLLASSAPTATHPPKPSQTSPTHRPAHPHHGASHPGHQARGSSKGAPSSGPAGGSAGKGAASAAGAAGSVRAPRSPGGTGPGVSPAPSIPTTTTFSGGTVLFYLYPNPDPDGGPAVTWRMCSSPLTYDAAEHDNVGTCSYTAGSEWAGSDLVVAEYSGYGQYEESSSPAEPLTITATPTQTTLTVNQTTASPGQRVTLTASITDQAGDNLSGGKAAFYLYVGPAETEMCSLGPVTYDPATHDNVATCSYTIPSQLLGSASSATATMYAEYEDAAGAYLYSTSSGVPVTVRG